MNIGAVIHQKLCTVHYKFHFKNKNEIRSRNLMAYKTSIEDTSPAITPGI